MIQLNYAIVFTSDMERSVAFYRDVFGLPLRFETPEWTEFSTRGATLALHKTDNPRVNETKSELTTAGRCRPGLGVENLDDFHSRVVESGVTCIQTPKNVFGSRIAQYLDPDGLVISVSEMSKIA